ELENTAHWACGRPTATELNGLDSDNDEFQAFKAAYDAQMGNMADAVSNMDLSHANPWHGHQPVADNVEHEGDGEDSAGHVEAQGSSEGGTSHQGLEDDEVLLATSDDDEAPPNQGSPLLPDQPQLHETDAQGPAPPLSPRPSGVCSFRALVQPL
ncbi:hypothetical protein HaLaN_06013, partial [Haematococcus lacustris]